MARAHTWNFFRAGGFDRGELETAADCLMAGRNRVSGMYL
jgi:hypothetical protein